MIGDTVAIQIPETVSERDEGRTIGACEAALGEERCGRLSQGFVADYTARVVQSSASEVTIELSLTGLYDAVTVRVLQFSDDEPEAFRWQSVGVVVGALVLAQPEVEEKTSAPAEPLPAQPKEIESKDREESPTKPGEVLDVRRDSEGEPFDRATVDVAPLVASSYSGSGVAGGAWLGAAVRLAGPVHVVTQGDASFSPENADAADLRTSSSGASLGLGLRGYFRTSDFGWDLSGRGAVQNLNVRADSGTEVGAKGTIRWGARAGGGLFWLPSRLFGVVLGADLGILWPPVDLELGQVERTRVGAIFWGGYLGLRIRLNRS